MFVNVYVVRPSGQTSWNMTSERIGALHTLTKKCGIYKIKKIEKNVILTFCSVCSLSVKTLKARQQIFFKNGLRFVGF